MASTTTRDDQTHLRPAWPRHRRAADADTIDLTDDRADRADRMAPADQHFDRDLRPRRAGFAYTLRVMLSSLLLAAIVVAAAVNTADVELDYIADTTTAPLWWVIAAAAVAGLVLGRLMPRTGKD